MDPIKSSQEQGQQQKIDDEERLAQPLLAEEESIDDPSQQQKTPAQRLVRKAFKGTAHLANLLPTGSVLTFQVLSPVVTHEGQCKSFVSQTTTLGFLGMCSLACFLLCFTDSFRDDKGKVRYGVATFRGLWVLDGSHVEVLIKEEASKFRLRFVDFFHAVMSVAVFFAVAMLDKNVIGCFYPNQTEEAAEVLAAFPVGVGVVCSILFVLFPTKRHGIGFPLSKR